jgi:hypothetical protein
MLPVEEAGRSEGISRSRKRHTMLSSASGNEAPSMNQLNCLSDKRQEQNEENEENEEIEEIEKKDQ